MPKSKNIPKQTNKNQTVDTNATDDLFVAFDEWASEQDDEAFSDL